MGFGYNPDLASKGERLDMLNFFTWMKIIQRNTGATPIIYDASNYYIVNRIPNKRIKKLGDKPTAEQILDVIVTELDEPNRSDIRENCYVRRLYLNALIKVSQLDKSSDGDLENKAFIAEGFGPSIFVRANYKVGLSRAIEFVKKLERENPDLVAKINPKSLNPASKLYLPLEIAETIFLDIDYGCRTKFGPMSEEFFDKAILKYFEAYQSSKIATVTPYRTIRCSYGPRKPGYLTDNRDVIWTTSTDSDIAEILRINEVDKMLGINQEYRNFVSSYLKPFRNNGESLEECAIRIKSQLRMSAFISDLFGG